MKGLVPFRHECEEMSCLTYCQVARQHRRRRCDRRVVRWYPVGAGDREPLGRRSGGLDFGATIGVMSIEELQAEALKLGAGARAHLAADSGCSVF
jgi:hypothetical protein